MRVKQALRSAPAGGANCSRRDVGFWKAMLLDVLAEDKEVPEHLDLGDHRGKGVEVVAAHIAEGFEHV